MANDEEKKDLQDRFVQELTELTESGAGVPLVFSPPEAFMLLSLLQLALRHPDLTMFGNVDAFAKDLARNIEERLCASRPAMAEVARRGWDALYDTMTFSISGDSTHRAKNHDSSC